MSRHHNRAILSEITEKKLDPKKEYVVGKNGLQLSVNELKKQKVQFVTSNLATQTKSDAVEVAKETIEQSQTKEQEPTFLDVQAPVAIESVEEETKKELVEELSTETTKVKKKQIKQKPFIQS